MILPWVRAQVKWWKPKNGKYSGDWEKWTKDGRNRVQYNTSIDRANVEMVDLGFTTNKEKTGGLWKLNKATLANLSKFKESKYSQFAWFALFLRKLGEL